MHTQQVPNYYAASSKSYTAILLINIVDQRCCPHKFPLTTFPSFKFLVISIKCEPTRVEQNSDVEIMIVHSSRQMLTSLSNILLFTLFTKNDVNNIPCTIAHLMTRLIFAN